MYQKNIKLNGNTSFISGCILIIILLSFSTIAQERPRYCKYYPDFSKEIPQVGVSDKFHKKNLSIICINSKPLSIKLSKLSKIMSNVQESTVDQMGQQFEKRLQQTALSSILDTKLVYTGLFEDQKYPPATDLSSCINVRANYKDNKIKSRMELSLKRNESNLKVATFSKIKQKAMIKLNLINALKANALFDRNTNHYKNLDKIDFLASQGRYACNSENLKCRKRTSIFSNTYHCSENKEKCYLIVSEKKKKQITKTNQLIKPLYRMVKSSPLLFQNSNDDSVIAPFLTSKLDRSPFMDKLLDKIPLSMNKEMHLAISQNDPKALNMFLNRNSKALNAIVDNPNNYKGFLDAASSAVSKKLVDLNQAAGEICSGNGDNLHHYPGLVNLTMNKMFARAGKENLSHQILSGQAAYCHLLNTRPFGESQKSWASISGFTLLGVGAALQFVPVAGNMVGAGVMLAGGTILTGKGYNDFLESDSKYVQENGLHMSGLQGYEDLLKSKNDRDSNLAWSIADTALLPFDLIFALKMVKKEARTSKVSSSLDSPVKDLEQAYKHEGEVTLFGDETDEVLTWNKAASTIQPIVKEGSIPLEDSFEMIRKDYITENKNKIVTRKEIESELNTSIMKNGKEISINGQNIEVVEVLGRGTEGTVYLVKTENGLQSYKVFDNFEGYKKGIKDFESLATDGLPHTEVKNLHPENNAILLEYVHGVPPQQIVENGAKYGIPEVERNRIQKLHYEFYTRTGVEPVEGNILYDLNSKQLIIIDRH